MHDESRNDAKEDYLSGMKYKDIADKYDVSINTVKSWKQRNGWERGPNKKAVHPKSKKGAHKVEKVAPKIGLLCQESGHKSTNKFDFQFKLLNLIF
ncbi:terminase gpP N-terminus-related DNA-binding protein, partial [Latilactobacillus curvatus]|uniref:terminase gpP N-terminus-related DNA-binding protein n=1 Tax=Latilactobacillus curvatus TaxID=28038 RepID=UPI0005546897